MVPLRSSQSFYLKQEEGKSRWSRCAGDKCRIDPCPQTFPHRDAFRSLVRVGEIIIHVIDIYRIITRKDDWNHVLFILTGRAGRESSTGRAVAPFSLDKLAWSGL
jgi:hypothetical protein